MEILKYPKVDESATSYNCGEIKNREYRGNTASISYICVYTYIFYFILRLTFSLKRTLISSGRKVIGSG